MIGTRRTWCLATVACLVVASQAASATWLVSDFETPNASTQAARSLASTGRYATGGGERLWGPNAPSTDEPLRFFVLPGEPLYLAAAFETVPPRLLRFVHLPVTTLLLFSVAAFAGAFGGLRLACATALVATLDPFVVVHGPVWDDTFLAAALLWFALAVVGMRISTKATAPTSASAILGAIAIAGAAITRGDVMLIVILLFIMAMLVPSLRPARKVVMLYGACTSMALAAWGARNHRVVGSFEIGSSHDGITLWESNGPYTTDALRRGQVMMLSADLDRMTPLWIQTQDLDEVEANRFFARRAVDYVRLHPVAALALSARKALLSLGAIRPELPMASTRNLVGVLSNMAIMLLATLGAYSYGRDRSPARLAPVLLVTPLLVTGALVLLIGPIGARYRVTLDGVLWILAAHGLLSLWSAAVGRLRRETA